jgi:hypothetical protein
MRLGKRTDRWIGRGWIGRGGVSAVGLARSGGAACELSASPNRSLLPVFGEATRTARPAGDRWDGGRRMKRWFACLLACLLACFVLKACRWLCAATGACGGLWCSRLVARTIFTSHSALPAARRGWANARECARPSRFEDPSGTRHAPSGPPAVNCLVLSPRFDENTGRRGCLFRLAGPQAPAKGRADRSVVLSRCLNLCPSIYAHAARDGGCHGDRKEQRGPDQFPPADKVLSPSQIPAERPCL